MSGYLYVVGLFMMFCLCSAVNAGRKDGDKLHPLFAMMISVIWPVAFPAILVGTLLTIVLEIVRNEEKE